VRHDGPDVDDFMLMVLPILIEKAKASRETPDLDAAIESVRRRVSNAMPRIRNKRRGGES
jgi:hypothetical protein